MPPPPALETWLPYRRPNPAATVRLVCLPFAGGGASAYRNWSDGLPLTVDVCAVQPPGRETRFRDPPYSKLQPYVTALADAIPALFDVPVVVFGHSMGALAAFELARELRRRGGPSRARLVVSGRGAPDLPLLRPPLHALPDREFRAELKRLGGTPAAVLDNDELMAAFLPTLRADFTALETYVYTDEPPLDCPILAVTGGDDTLAPPVDVDAWRRHTRAAFEVRVLAGDHFFLQTHRATFLQLLARYLQTPS
jgi:surfactin synthase thioesterase subunit